ncbi:hypothetical protein NC661_13400 [Aquibacillus koreensis]|uniref:Uncharacterized protein n=1 Tax=Aquibacillus koreensis TaxID=279446 RepID=A0A9X3WPT7_9BACI|nr:hypothetical protein [Aquibacillus koreensis]MCT2536283.1 hypothetical protein [Aquibacillus koreensis]MDC3421366.1 hypothetical protein [Aquibacillus koreensis]
MSNGKSKKVLRIVTNIILVIILIGATQMFFDNNYHNDHYGWLFILAFWMVRCLYEFIINIQDGNKKSAVFDLALLIVASYFFISGIDYL